MSVSHSPWTLSVGRTSGNYSPQIGMRLRPAEGASVHGLAGLRRGAGAAHTLLSVWAAAGVFGAGDLTGPSSLTGGGQPALAGRSPLLAVHIARASRAASDAPAPHQHRQQHSKHLQPPGVSMPQLLANAKHAEGEQHGDRPPQRERLRQPRDRSHEGEQVPMSEASSMDNASTQTCGSAAAPWAGGRGGKEWSRAGDDPRWKRTRDDPNGSRSVRDRWQSG